MKTWNHSGFNIYCGSPIYPDDQKGIVNLAEYIKGNIIFIPTGCILHINCLKSMDFVVIY